jgi:GT2 family glycosyltransferase
VENTPGSGKRRNWVHLQEEINSLDFANGKNMTDKSVYTVILNFNHLEDLKETILSFRNQDYPNHKIIVSDNGSSDKSTEWLKETYPGIKLFENNQNLGWSGGNNVGIKYALANNADYILLANNDLAFDDKCLISSMVTDLERFKNDRIRILGTQVNYYNEKNQTHNTGWIMYPKGEKRDIFFNEFRKKCKIDLDPSYRLVDSADGSFFMIGAEVFNQAGLLREELFMYADEIDFSMRAWAKGIISVVNTGLTIYHKVGTSSIPNSPFSVYYRNRNLLILIKSNGKKFHFLQVYFKDVLKALFRNIFNRGITMRKKIEIQNAVFKGIADGLFNKLGKRV